MDQTQRIDIDPSAQQRNEEAIEIEEDGSAGTYTITDSGGGGTSGRRGGSTAGRIVDEIEGGIAIANAPDDETRGERIVDEIEGGIEILDQDVLGGGYVDGVTDRIQWGIGQGRDIVQ